MIKIGINLLLWTSKVEKQHLPLFEQLKTAGFDGLEIPLADYSQKNLGEIVSALQHNQLACTASTMLPAHCNPVSEDPAARDHARAKLRADIELAAALGAEKLVGPIHSSHKVFSGTGPSRDELMRCSDFLADSADYAQQHQIELGVEFLNRFECYVLNNCAQTRALLEPINHRSLAIHYDTHHAHIEERDPYQAIIDNATLIKHIHISESHRGTPGLGQVDWQQTFRAIKQINYQGWLTIEAFGTGDASLASAANVWRNCFSSEQEVYSQGMDLIKAYLKDGQAGS